MTDSQKQAFIRLYQFYKSQEESNLNNQVPGKWAFWSEGSAIAWESAADQLKFFLQMWCDIEILPLVETDEYLEQVAEESKHDNEPDHEEREHIEEMEYRSNQMGSI
jgi:hypothetical protein